MSSATDGLEVAVRRRLGEFRLDAAFRAPARGLVALFGPSGSGKTSLVAAIAGLLEPDAGRIALGGETLFDSARGIDVPAERRRIGCVFQDARLFPHLSVAANLDYGAKRVRGGTPATASVSRDALIELLGIGHLLARRPAALSGGEKQRVAIGRTLLAQPRLLLLDEPLASLDLARRDEILPVVERLRDELGVPIVYVSHSIDEVVRLAGEVAVMDAGRVVAQGRLAELALREDLQPLVGRLEPESVLPGRVERHDGERLLTQVGCGDRVLALPLLSIPAGTPVRLRIRARDVIVALSVPRDISAQNALPATVVSVGANGPYADVVLDLGAATLLARITRDSARRLGLAEGRAVYALVKSAMIDPQVAGAAPLDGNQLRKT